MDEYTALMSLVGEHELSGVGFHAEEHKDYNTTTYTNCIDFILDGKTYTVTEDPCDGYRSYMGELQVDKHIVTNTFGPIKVVCNMSEERDNDTLLIIDVITRKTIVEVGTDNTNDYYPYFVCDFYPQNMCLNQGVEDEDYTKDSTTSSGVEAAS